MNRDVPIIFSGPMVRALLAGRKTITRRLAWRDPFSIYDDEDGRQAAIERRKGCKVSGPDDLGTRIGWPPASWQKVKVGDRLWVREAWRVSSNYDAEKPRDLTPRKMTMLYEAGGSMGGISTPPKDGSLRPAAEYVPDDGYPDARPPWAGKLRPPIFLPRWASRLTQVVTGTKIERLQEITEADAIAEGIYPEIVPEGTLWHSGAFDKDGEITALSAITCYRRLWEYLHGENAWLDNPEVVAITGTVIKANIDAPEARAA